MTIRTITARPATLVASLLAASTALAAPGGGPVMYGSIPDDLPGNVTGQAYEAWGVTEAGDRITFVPGTGGMMRRVTVALSSRACEKGSGASCSTTTGKTFDQSVTLNLYSLDGNDPDVTIASMTKTFEIPYRPSASPSCPEGKWFSAADNTCYGGIATTVTFDFPSPGVPVPDTVVWGVTVNTTHYGPSPLGTATSCYPSPAGCPYDSLSLGAETFPGLVGTDVDPDGAYLDSSASGAYCGAGGTGFLRLDNGCRSDLRPLARFVGASSEECKRNGWRVFTNPPFASEADCKAFFDNL